MVPPNPRKPRVFVGADVLFAGAASPTEHGASLVVLRLAEITLVEALASEQVVMEAERNLKAKLPNALPAFRLIVSRCLHVVPDPEPGDLEPYTGLAHQEEMPILVAALREGCRWLVTFNIRHFRPGSPEITVLPPGEFVLHMRDLLAHLAVEEGE